MDTIYIIILIVFALLIFLHLRDHVNEPFLPPDYFQKNPMTVSLSNEDKNFQNFAESPPNPLCNNCNLNYNCMNLPYTQLSDTHQNVCTRCGVPTVQNYYNEQEKITVMGRSAGRGRVCRLVN
jgi:hypothetical protein